MELLVANAEQNMKEMESVAVRVSYIHIFNTIGQGRRNRSGWSGHIAWLGNGR